MTASDTQDLLPTILPSSSVLAWSALVAPGRLDSPAHRREQAAIWSLFRRFLKSECHLAKVDVAGSSPVSRSRSSR